MPLSRDSPPQGLREFDTNLKIAAVLFLCGRGGAGRGAPAPLNDLPTKNKAFSLHSLLLPQRPGPPRLTEMEPERWSCWWRQGLGPGLQAGRSRPQAGGRPRPGPSESWGRGPPVSCDTVCDVIPHGAVDGVWQSLSPVRLLATSWTVARPAPLSMEWSSKNAGVGCHSLLQCIFSTQRLNPGLPHCRQILNRLSYQGSPNGWSPRPQMAVCGRLWAGDSGLTRH